MSNPTNNGHRPAVHPLIITAAIAVVLFCAVGIAAIMGWLPSSNGSNAPPVAATALTPADQRPAAPLPPATVAAPPVPAPALAATPHPQAAPAQREPKRREPVHETVRDEPARQAAICHSCGVVESVREIKSRADGSGVGAAGGAVVGGLLGRQVGGGRGRDVATVVGAIGGAVAGNQIEGQVRANTSYDITVRMNDGSSRTIHEANQTNWHSGDRVRVVDGALRANG